MSIPQASEARTSEIPLFFDSVWYLRANPDVADSSLSAADHFLTYGMNEGRSPHPFFDGDWYLKRNPDVAASGLSAPAHFLTYGMAEGRSPHPFFDGDWYLKKNPDVAASGLSAPAHFLTYGIAEGRSPHPLFHPTWYLRSNPDVAASGLSPTAHFILYGITEERSPHPLFDASFYLRTTGEENDIETSPLDHFLNIGLPAGKSPHPLIDPDWYLIINGDVAAGKINPVQHFFAFGIDEGRNPHPIFDEEWYLQIYPSAKESTCTPIEHFASFGLPEGVSPHPLFDARWYRTQYPDVDDYKISSLLFFLEYGLSRGDIPTPIFDQEYYLDRNIDGGMDLRPPFEKYLYDEYRAGITPTLLFDEKFYCATYGQHLKPGQPPFLHFLKFGQFLGLNPHPLFDTPWYEKSLGSELLNVTAFSHYLTESALSSPHPAFDPNFVAQQLLRLPAKYSSREERGSTYARNKDVDQSTIAFTSIALNYLPQAIVLGESLKRYSANVYFVIVLCDDNNHLDFEKYACIDEVIHLNDLISSRSEQWIFRHALVELCTAVKGPALKHLLQRDTCKSVLYLDPDIMFFNDIAPIEKALKNASIILTPHLLHPEQNSTAIEQNEFDALKHGAFNLGFLAVAKTWEGLRFADWWSDRLKHYCFDEKATGLFVDQKWMDIAPGLFSGLEVLRHPGCNVAPWNLSQRKIASGTHSGFSVAGEPLIFFHFSGYMSGAGRRMFNRYTSAADPARQLYEIYVRETAIKTAIVGPTPPWIYGSYDNGTEINIEHRKIYRQRTDLQSLFPEPRSTKPGPTYFGWLRQHGHLSRTHRCMEFDAQWYLERYPDVAASGMDPRQHYQTHGRQEGRFANARAKTLIVSGRESLRRPLLMQYLAQQDLHNLRPNTLFDPAYYKRIYRDIAESDIDPLVHFLSLGLREGRKGCRDFDPAFYASQTDLLSPEESFWNVLESGGSNEIRPTPAYIEAWDAGVLSKIKSRLIPGRTKILMITHQWGGGTTKAVNDLCTYIRDRAHIMILSSTTSGLMALEPFDKSEPPLFFDTVDVDNVLIDVLHYIGFDRLHIHHVLGMNQSATTIALNLALPYDVTLHDTYFLTPNPLFTHSEDARTADGLEAAMRRDAATPLNRSNPDDTSIDDWRARYTPLLYAAHRVISPSQFMADVYNSVYPTLPITVVPHLEQQELRAPKPIAKLAHDESLRIALIADLGEHKGARVLQQCALLALINKMPLRFFLIGKGTGTFRGVNISVTGAYDSQSLLDILSEHKINIIWLPYRAPESYSFVLSSALSSGLPISATDVGCFPERTHDYPQAFVLPVETSAREWLSHFMTLRNAYQHGGLDRRTYQPPSSDFYRFSYLPQPNSDEFARGAPNTRTVKPI